MPFSNDDVYAIRDIFALTYDDEPSILYYLNAQYSRYGDRAVNDIRDLIDQINTKSEAIAKAEAADQGYLSVQVDGEYQITSQRQVTAIAGARKPNLWRERSLLINKLSALTGIQPNSSTLTVRS